jgi:hypothetical protein
MGKDNVGNTPPASQAPKIDAEHPGYEVSDVNTGGVAAFLAGLFGTVIVFFFFCYGMGKVINNLWIKQDGPATRWTIAAGEVPAGKGNNLASDTEIKQRQLQTMVSNFPTPRLDIDDGEQATADLHAREDLLLNNYSTVDGQPGTIRIPIDRAMQLIAQRGLPVESAQANAPDSVAYANKPVIKAPLTTGFARTGFEETTIEARAQKMDFNKAEASAETAPSPGK